MKTIDISKKYPYSPLIPAMEAICKAKPGDKLEFIIHDRECFADLKEYLSEKNIGFREIYEDEKMILQFVII